MSDTPKPPPLPANVPIRLVRPRSKQENLLRAENAQLRADLEAERALVEVLRNQPTTAEARATEETLPGIGAPQRYRGSLRSRKRASGARRLGKWVALGAAALGLAVELARLRYPGLVGPIELVRQALEAFQ